MSAAPVRSVSRSRSSSTYVRSTPAIAVMGCAPSWPDWWKPTSSTRAAGRCKVTPFAFANGTYACSARTRFDAAGAGDAGGGTVGATVVGGGGGAVVGGAVVGGTTVVVGGGAVVDVDVLVVAVVDVLVVDVVLD